VRGKSDPLRGGHLFQAARRNISENSGRIGGSSDVACIVKGGLEGVKTSAEIKKRNQGEMGV